MNKTKRPFWGEGGEGKEATPEITIKEAGSTSVVGNRILFYQQVTQESMHDLVQKLRETEEDILRTAVSWGLEEDKVPPIKLHINSYGGEVFAALGALDHIMTSKVPVHTYVDGGVASAATLLSICGAKRFIYPNGFMLIHQISSGFWGKYEEWKDENENMELLMDKVKDLYIEKARIPEGDLAAILKRDIWLDAMKCQEWGLVDSIKDE